MTREDIIRMARETGVEWLMHNQFYKDHLQHFAALVAAAEREACAKVCEEQEKRSTAAQIKAKRESDKAIYSAAAQTANWNAAAIEQAKQSQWGASAVTKPEYVAAQKEKTQQALDKMAENERELGIQMQPEPVAWIEHNTGRNYDEDQLNWQQCEVTDTPLYTSPQPSKPWVGLSTDEIYDMYNEPRSDAEMVEFARAIEAKLKEKNK